MAIDVQLSSNSPGADAGFRNAKVRITGTNPTFASFEVPNHGGVDPRTTTSETIGAASRGKIVTLSNSSAVAVTLSSSVDSTFMAYVANRGTGIATLTPSSGTIDGAASLALAQNQGVVVFFDGTNWETDRGLASSSPLTTKGDLYTRSSSADSRLPVGADGTTLVADSTQTLGMKWAAPGSSGGANLIGAIGSLPGSGSAAGQAYYCTDAPYTFVWTGTIWQAYYGSIPVTQPILGNFSTNCSFPGGTTKTQNNGTILFTAVGTSFDVIRALIVTPPATPYNYCVGFNAEMLALPSNFVRCGLFLGNSSSGKCVTFEWICTGATVSSQTFPQYLLQVNRWTQNSSGAAASFSATVFAELFTPSGPLYLQGKNDGTTLTFYYPGNNPFSAGSSTFTTEALSSWVSSVDQAGFFVTSFTGGLGFVSKMEVFHFAQS